MKYPIGIAWEAVKRTLHSWRFRDRFKIVRVEEVPDVLRSERLYLIGYEAPWSAAMVCPCGCGETIHISLLLNDPPSWTLSSDRYGLPTLTPSVWRTKGCRSHFFLRQGTIVWCRPEEVRRDSSRRKRRSR